MSDGGVGMSDGEQIESCEPGRARPRFSLSTLLLVTTIAALGVAVWQLGREVVPMREEVRRLRDEVGDLFVEDESKLCAIRVRTDDDLTWKWRVWIPPGRGYRLRTDQVAGHKVSKEGFGTRGGTITMRDSGEYWVKYQIRQDLIDGKWYGSLSWEGGSVCKDLQEWVEWPQKTATGTGVGYSVKVHNSTGPFELIRYRVSQSADDSEDIEDPSSGVHVWLEAR